MTSINQPASEVFDRLIAQLGSKDYIRLEAAGMAPLSFECIGQVYCLYGPAKMYSLMQSFTQNGELMLYPEICFYHFDNNKNHLCGAYPYSYQLDLLGISQTSIIINDEGDLEIQYFLQKQHTGFANNWLRHIKEQGFIK